MPGGFGALEVYKEARTLRKRVYKLAAQLPAEERFGLAPQMRRAAVSVTNNIAEGHGSRNFRHNISYLYRARGSLCELLDDINACQDEEYFLKDHLENLRQQATTVIKLLNGYVSYLRRRSAETEKPSPGAEPD